jgi:hypothetical protein
MNSCVGYLANITSTMFLTLAAITGALAQNVPDKTKIWTAVGSTGTLDKSGENTSVFFAQSTVQIGMATTTGAVASLKSRIPLPPHIETAVLRYNVTAVDGLFDPSITSPMIGVALKLRYLAVNAQVIAKLLEVSMEGTENFLLTFDSDQFPARDDYHVNVAENCNAGPRPIFFDFTQKAYYIEATLTADRFRADSAAGIQLIQLVKCGPAPQ